MIWKINSGLWSGLEFERKGFGSIMSNFWGKSFKVFMDNSKFFWKYVRVRTEELNRIKVKKRQKNEESIFYGEKNQFFRDKNLSVNTWRSGPYICSLICEVILSYCYCPGCANTQIITLQHIHINITLLYNCHKIIQTWYIVLWNLNEALLHPIKMH